MLSTKIHNKKTEDVGPQHLWANDPRTKKIRRQLIIYWIRSSIVFWILILLVALIYLGSARVRIK